MLSVSNKKSPAIIHDVHFEANASCCKSNSIGKNLIAFGIFMASGGVAALICAKFQLIQTKTATYAVAVGGITASGTLFVGIIMVSQTSPRPPRSARRLPPKKEHTVDLWLQDDCLSLVQQEFVTRDALRENMSKLRGKDLFHQILILDPLAFEKLKMGTITADTQVCGLKITYRELCLEVITTSRLSLPPKKEHSDDLWPQDGYFLFVQQGIVTLDELRKSISELGDKDLFHQILMLYPDTCEKLKMGTITAGTQVCGLQMTYRGLFLEAMTEYANTISIVGSSAEMGTRFSIDYDTFIGQVPYNHLLYPLLACGIAKLEDFRGDVPTAILSRFCESSFDGLKKTYNFFEIVQSRQYTFDALLRCMPHLKQLKPFHQMLELYSPHLLEKLRKREINGLTQVCGLQTTYRELFLKELESFDHETFDNTVDYEEFRLNPPYSELLDDLLACGIAKEEDFKQVRWR